MFPLALLNLIGNIPFGKRPKSYSAFLYLCTNFSGTKLRAHYEVAANQA